MTEQPAGSIQAEACLFCGRRVAWIERRCPAFALAGVAAHVGCCGGCASNSAGHKPTTSTAAR